MLFQTRKVSRENPVIRQVPQSLLTTSASAAPVSKLSYAGYDFEVPWSDLENEPRVLTNGAALRFKSGMGLLFLTSPPKELVSSLCEEAVKAKPGTVRLLYGDDAVRSDYDLKRVMLETTPGKVNLFSSRRDVIRNSMLLILKISTLSKDAESGIFSISNERFKGFQIGNPEMHPQKVIVDLYSDDGSVELVFRQQEGKLSISQADVNRVIQTLRRTGPPLRPVDVPKGCL